RRRDRLHSRSGTMLRLSGVAKVFGRHRVLDDVTLEVGAGESVALLGANGSGKTTTLACIVGLARPDAGCITVAGIDVAARPVTARSRMSYLPQKSVFPPTLSVRETLAGGAKLRGLPAGGVGRETAPWAHGP